MTHAETFFSILENAGSRVIAVVQDSPRAVDIAVGLAVVRVVETVDPSDHIALKTILRQGDFDRAILIYCDDDQPDLPDDIESWSIRDVETLAASLAREGAVL